MTSSVRSFRLRPKRSKRILPRGLRWVQNVLAVQIAITLLFMIFPAVGRAEVKGRISGLTYFDYFYNTQGSGVARNDNGFQFRRIYFTYEDELDDDFSFRFRLEANQSERTSKQDKDSKIAVFVKHAYLKWENLIPQGAVYIALSATPLWGNTEKLWGYRSIERTLLDQRGIGSSADIGVAVKGRFGEQSPLSYHVMFGNGEGQEPEDDSFKKGYLGMWFKSRGFLVEGVGDFEGGPGREDRYTIKGLLGYSGEDWALGVEGFLRTNRAAHDTLPDVKPAGVSGFARVDLSSKLTALGRVDFFEPDSEEDAVGHKQIFIIGGLDFQPSSNVHLIPNTEITVYDEKELSLERDTDVVVRATVYYLFK